MQHNYKVGRYFQLKSATPITLSSNVLYQCLCSFATNLSNVVLTLGMFATLETRAREHLNQADNTKSAIKDHLYDCGKCSAMSYSVPFKVVRKCVTEYDTEIQEALLIKKLNPKLSKQLYAKGPYFYLVFFSYILVCIIVLFLP